MKSKENTSKTKPTTELKADSDPNKLIGNSEQKVSESPKENLYSCTLLKFAEYVEGTNGAKNAVIRDKKRKKSGGFPWYKDAITVIKRSLIENSNIPYHEGINFLKSQNSEKLNNNQKLNIKYSTQVLEGLLELTPTFDFRKLNKIEFKPSLKSFMLNEIEIKVSLNRIVFFKAKHNGETIIGGALINFKQKPFTNVQMRVAAYLLHTFLANHIAKKGELVHPKFCICLDAYGKKIVEAPSGIDAIKTRKSIADEQDEFKKRWLTL